MTGERSSSATATTVDVSSGMFESSSILREREELALAVANQVTVRAIYHQVVGDLYMKITWEDADHDVWPQRWEVTSVTDGVPTFSRGTTVDEDRLLVFFEDQANSLWDAWYWRGLIDVQRLNALEKLL